MCIVFHNSGFSVADQNQYNVAVIGAGIAGASAAAEISSHATVLLLEMERQPGYHSTGRSAAAFSETYGPAPIRALTRASADFYGNPPAGFTANPLLSQRGVILIAREDQIVSLEEMIAELSDSDSMQQLSAHETEARIPLLRKGYAAASLIDRKVSDIDVDALHQGYLRLFRSNGGVIKTDSEVEALERTSDRWSITTKSGHYEAKIIVNAAGAWADKIGALAGASVIGLKPKRRTAIVVAAPANVSPDAWPMVVDIDEKFYLKPDAGRLLISPADETVSPPCDIQPDELDIAICMDRIETAFDLSIQRIENKWAGLRSFVADKCPVCGFDGRAPDFFWLAGQGGYGIQTAPALARIAASQVLHQHVPQAALDQGVRLEDLSPMRPTLKGLKIQ